MDKLIEKLKEEESELSNKIDKLENFLENKSFVVSQEQLVLLREQRSYMILYYSVLCKRIINLLEVENV